MGITSRPLVTIGTPGNVHYLESVHLQKWTDVFILSQSNTRFAFNKLCLASISRMLEDAMLCCSEDDAYISSELTDEDLHHLQRICFGTWDEKTKLSSILRQWNFGADNFKSDSEFVKDEKCLSTQELLPKESQQSDDKAEEIYVQDSDFVTAELDKTCSLGGRRTLTATSQFSENHEISHIVENGQIIDSQSSTINTTTFPKRTQTWHVKAHERKEAYFFFPNEEKCPRDLSLLYQCHRCSRGFRSVEAYRQHYHRHDVVEAQGKVDYNRAFACFKCQEFESSSLRDVKKHRCTVPEHQEEASSSRIFYYCPPCDTRFVTARLLVAHRSQHHRGRGLEEPVCPSCGKKFMSQNGLSDHMKVNGPYHRRGRCGWCRKQFKSWSEHQAHLDQHHSGIQKHVCGHCDVSAFDTVEKMTEHRMFCRVIAASVQVNPTGEGEVACTVCGDAVKASIHGVKGHLETHHAGLLKFKCEKCSKPFTNKYLLTVHIQQVHQEKTFNCSVCDRSFRNKSQLGCHQKSHSSQFTCNQCNKTFVNKGTLKIHTKRVHDPKFKEVENAKVRVCELCGKTFPEANYNYHLRYMHGSDQVQCSECDKVFNHKLRLAIHIRQAHRKQQCPLCGLEVGVMRMRNHKLVHHAADISEFPFSCKPCNKGFTSKHKYRNHTNIHTGERPWSCRFCSLTFVDSSNCNKHMRTSHAEAFKAYKASKQL